MWDSNECFLTTPTPHINNKSIRDHVDKCCIMNIGKLDFYVNDCILSSSTNWHTGISNMIAKAHQRAIMILRTFCIAWHQRTHSCFYCLCIRPILEYSSTAWSPQYVGDIECVEQVQRKCFTKVLHELRAYAYTYADRLRALDLQSFELRCLDLIWCYKLLSSALST